MADGAAKQPPIEAFRFFAPAAQVLRESNEGRRKFSGIAYSGEVITGHAWWTAVVFDLASTRAPERIPALVDHDRRARAGFAALNITPDRIEAVGELLPNPTGTAIAEDADHGFPWQMSVHIDPARIEEVQPGAKTTVNGREVTGPAVIFRDNVIREVSFTPTGADDGTSARVFSAHSASPTPSHPQEDPDMAEKEALEARNAELQASLDAATAQIEQLAARAETAETALREQQFAARTESVKSLFAAIGREFTDEAAKPYVEMGAEQFSAVAEDLRKQAEQTRSRLPDYLFSAQATGGDQDRTDAERIASHVNRSKG